MEDLSLLHTRIFQVETRDGNATQNLPEILHALVEDQIVSFQALQSHQEQPWYSFLVQLGAMAAVRANDKAVPVSEEEWRSALLSLSDTDENAWCLVVSDPHKPAFMQPPIEEDSLDDAKYKADIPSPSNLDVLVTSKNHDVKQQRIRDPRPEHWTYALITLQTMEGFLGRGNYGITRGVNGGFGNRSFVGLSPALSFGSRFKRDLRVLVDRHDALNNLYDPEDGLALTWTRSWDGGKKSGIPLSECDPYFIEICRRIRFQEEDGRIVCWRANTKAQRIDAPPSLNGRTEDPWVPVDKEGEKALTLGGSGFTYDKIQEIFLGGKYARPDALRFHKWDSGAMYLTARAMVRGQGKTEGLHHRIIPVPESVPTLFADEDARDRLAKRAKARVELVSDVEANVLRPAVASLLSAGRDGSVDWELVQPWIDDFDQAVDDHFFDYLWASVSNEEANADHAWKHFLKDEAIRVFEDAKDGVPMPDIRRWRALSAGHNVFYSRIDEYLGDAEPSSAS